MRLFGLIGFPLSHSFSKKYFDKKFEIEGLTNCRFENFPIPDIEEFPDVLNKNPELKGIAVTIPYKKAVLKYVHDASSIPAGIEACNCIKITDHKIAAYNTDYIGFEKSLTPLLKVQHKKALVLGNGGATASVIYVLRKLGIEFNVVSRKIHNGSTLTYKDLDERIIKESTLIINTTPLGTYPDIKMCPEINYQFISTQHLLYDLIYNPSKTLFLQKGEDRGAVIKNGEEMLILQAEENWRIWNI